MITPLTQVGAPPALTISEVTHPTVGGSSDVWGSILNFSLKNIVAKVNELVTNQNNLTGSFVVGEVRAWVGDAALIPTVWAGWRLCDGSNGTPDLTGRVLVGTGVGFGVGDLGGSVQVTSNAAGAHSHNENTGVTALTVEQLPPHSHGVTDEGHTHDTVVANPTGNTGLDINNDVFLPSTFPDAPAVSNSATTGITINEAGGGLGHAHPISSDGAHAHSTNVMQPYYALHYIMYFG